MMTLRRCRCYWLVLIALVLPSIDSFKWNPSSTSTHRNRNQYLSSSSSSCREIVADYVASHDFQQQTALQRTVLFVPPEYCSSDVIYRQVATQSVCQGKHLLLQVSQQWWRESSLPLEQNDNADIMDDDDEWRLESKMVQISSLSPTTVQVSWNVTWIPPTAWIWHRLGRSIPGLRIVYCSYNHRSSMISTFSWKAVASVFLDAIQTRQWTVPLACIQGLSRLEFQRQDVQVEEVTEDGSLTASSSSWKLCSITEDLVYALDLQQGRLLNRKCADDLRLFLELGRRLPAANHKNQPLDVVVEQDWLDLVAVILPWSTVPGSGSLDIEPMEEGEGSTSTVLFLASSILAITCFATLVAPQLLGQSLF